MRRIVHKYKDFQQANVREIELQIALTAEQRQYIAKQLRQRTYGKKTQDVKDTDNENK